VVFLGGREQQVEIVEDPVDLLGAHEAVEENPAMLLPGVDLGVGGTSWSQGTVLLGWRDR
jgi:hypothetical protein